MPYFHIGHMKAIAVYNNCIPHLFACALCGTRTCACFKLCGKMAPIHQPRDIIKPTHLKHGNQTEHHGFCQQTRDRTHTPPAQHAAHQLKPSHLSGRLYHKEHPNTQQAHNTHTLNMHKPHPHHRQTTHSVSTNHTQSQQSSNSNAHKPNTPSQKP